MLRRLVLLLTFVFAGTAAHADPVTGNDASAFSKYIWQFDADGTARHQLSQWVCPAKLGDLVRDQIAVYDGFGFDVSCNYAKGTTTATFYLTRAPDSPLDTSFDGIKSALTQRVRGAVLLPDSQQKTFESSLTWRHAIYSYHGGDEYTGAWLSDLSGWQFEIRSDYAPADEKQAFDLLAAASQSAVATAGAHLDACAKAPSVNRNGNHITDQRQLMGFTLSATLVAFPGEKKPAAIASSEPNWCAENTLTVDNVPYVQWHNINPPGPVDRITPLGKSEVVVLSIADSLGPTLRKSDDPPAPPIIYHAISEDPDTINVFRTYDGIPSLDELAHFAAGVWRGINATVNKKTKKITLYAPT